MWTRVLAHVVSRLNGQMSGGISRRIPRPPSCRALRSPDKHERPTNIRRHPRPEGCLSPHVHLTSGKPQRIFHPNISTFLRQATHATADLLASRQTQSTMDKSCQDAAYPGLLVLVRAKSVLPIRLTTVRPVTMAILDGFPIPSPSSPFSKPLATPPSLWRNSNTTSTVAVDHFDGPSHSPVSSPLFSLATIKAYSQESLAMNTSERRLATRATA